MALMDFIKKQFIDVIAWTEDGDEVLAWRFPTADMEIQYGAMLTVRESQLAIFVNEGQVADVFGPGLHKLTTQTLPLLTNLKNWDKLFESPFKSEVYFFSTRVRLGRRWGTPQPVSIRDSDFGAVQVRAFGQYAWRIADAKQFYLQVSGTRESYRVADVEEQLRGATVSALATAIGSSGVPFLDLAANQTLLAQRIAAALEQGFVQWGLKLEDFQLVSLSLPEAIQEALDKRIRMGVIGDMNRYTQMQAADALPIAAGNEGGGVAGMAAQVAVGMAMGQAMNQGMAGALGRTAPAVAASDAAGVPADAAPASATVSSAADVEARLGQLKGLLDKGLISADDYQQAKQALIARLLG